MKKKDLIFIFLILIITFFNLRAFFKPGIFRGHDLENHLARIANYYLAVKDGHLPPRWAKNLNHKFGYPVFNFNYPLANILAYPLIVIGFSIEASLKIILFSAYFGAGFFFYLWAQKHFARLSSFIGACFYLTAPYQFVDFYIRGVVGENLSFCFFPAVLFFIQKMKEKHDFFSVTGLFLSILCFSLSHNIMVLLFTPLIFIYLFYLWKTETKDRMKIILAVVFLGFLSSSFFWIPALVEKKYVTLKAFNPKSFYQDHFVNLKQLIYSQWQYGFSVPGPEDTMTFQIGLVHLLTALISLIIFIKNIVYLKDRGRGSLSRLFVGALGLVLFFLTVFMMLPISSFFWNLVPLVGYLQFPWRFLGLTIFSSALLAGFLTQRLKFLGVCLGIAALIYCQQFTTPFLWEKKSDMYYYDFLFTTSTRHENKPIWFKESNISEFKSRLTSDSGLVAFKELNWETDEHIYEVNVPEQTVITEHTAYFPGWQVFIDGKRTKINYKDKNKGGLINYQAPRGKHQVKVKFLETPIRKTANFISFSSFVFLLGVVKFLPYDKKNKKQ